MSAKKRTKASPAGLGLRAVRGGSIVIGIALEDREPRIVAASRFATASEDDRLSLEPYHVAVEIARGAGAGGAAKAAAAVAEGRKRQDKLAAKGLKEIVRNLREAGFEPTLAALLVNRAGWVSDHLAYALAFPDHPPVAEGLAVRDALRSAIRSIDVTLLETDEKSLPTLAAQALRLPSSDIDARLKSLGAAVGRPWRKEQKLACLAAWVALATSK